VAVWLSGNALASINEVTPHRAWLVHGWVTVCRQINHNSHNNNNKDNNVYGAVIIAKATARVHPVHVMNMERRQAAADHKTRPNDPDCESACRLPEATPTIAIYYYYSARKLILVLPYQVNV